MQNLLLVGAGGALGAIARYVVNQMFLDRTGSQIIGTFLANTSGSFLLGLFVGLLSTHPSWSPETRMLIAVGFLGSYTTFSTFSVATVQLLQRGEFLLAVGNLGGSVVIGIMAALIGITVGRML